MNKVFRSDICYGMICVCSQMQMIMLLTWLEEKLKLAVP